MIIENNISEDYYNLFIQTTKNVMIINLENYNEQQVFMRVPLKLINYNQLNLTDLIDQLKKSTDLLNRSFLHLYLQERQEKKLIGADPLPKDKLINYNQIKDQETIILFFQQNNQKKVHSPRCQQSHFDTYSPDNCQNSSYYNYPLQQQAAPSESYDPVQTVKQQQQFSQLTKSDQVQLIKQKEQGFQQEQEQMMRKTPLLYNEEENDIDLSHKPREKRVKERKIQYVLEKVSKWRHFYEIGFMNEEGCMQKANLDISASMVGLSRKTLDDYYCQIKKGEQYGYDFNQNKDEKMGHLRKFVKAMEKSGQIEQQEKNKINSNQKKNFFREENKFSFTLAQNNNTNNQQQQQFSNNGLECQTLAKFQRNDLGQKLDENAYPRANQQNSQNNAQQTEAILYQQQQLIQQPENQNVSNNNNNFNDDNKSQMSLENEKPSYLQQLDIDQFFSFDFNPIKYQNNDSPLSFQMNLNNDYE